MVAARSNKTCTITSPVSKKQQKVVSQKEIAKRRQLHDEPESGIVQRQEAVATATSPPQSDEGSDEAESDDDNPPAGNAEKGNDDVEESRDDDTNIEEFGDKDTAVEESIEQVEDSEPGNTPESRTKRWFLQGCKDMYYAGLHLTEKGNPSRHIQEEPKIQINALNEVPKLKMIFEGYNMHWMKKTSGKYSTEMVCEFYVNYYYTLEKKASSKMVIKKEPVLDFVRVRAIPVDILERTITRVLMGGSNERDQKVEH
ncbi:hypothetical protein HAX54_012505 [Datura stramonium]|uniref:Uncharacterized protein n=1 Tax=Datura stramonium TaxID=4076 RepID=A0ABS8TJY8_DATST|nr:hypothetical protein [Datura stramonium]